MTERDLTDYELDLDRELGLPDYELDRMTSLVVNNYCNLIVTAEDAVTRGGTFRNSIQSSVESALLYGRFEAFMRQCDTKLMTRLQEQGRNREQCERAVSSFTQMVNLCCDTLRTPIEAVKHDEIWTDDQVEVMVSLDRVYEILDRLERERNQQYRGH